CDGPHRFSRDHHEILEKVCRLVEVGTNAPAAVKQVFSRRSSQLKSNRRLRCVNAKPLSTPSLGEFIACIRRRHRRRERREQLQVDSSNGRGTRWCERISTVTAESSDYGVNLRTVQNLFFQQLLSNLMEQTKVSL